MGCMNCKLVGDADDGDDYDVETEETPPYVTATALNSVANDTNLPSTSLGLANEVEGIQRKVEIVDQKATAPELNEGGDGDIMPQASCSINELIKSRKEAYHRKARENIKSELKAIFNKEKALRNPLNPFRPYGLGEEMEGLRRHVWDLVFVHVNDPKTIVNLRKVCTMFKDLLERKYVAARLPNTILLCLERKIIPWKAGTRTEISNWAKTMSSLKSLSKASKNSVDSLSEKAIGYPHYVGQCWKVPTLRFGSLDIEQVRLHETLETLDNASMECFPRVLIFNECRQNPLPINELQDLRNAFKKCVGKIGCRITSFQYRTFEDSSNAYSNLRGWVKHMANLKTLTVFFSEGQGQGQGTNHPENIKSFPTLRKLKRYVDQRQGFGHPFIIKILRANPTLEEVFLGNAPSSDQEVEDIKQILNNLPLKRLHWAWVPTISFLEHRFHWSLRLTTLILLDADSTGDIQDITSKKLFDFISSFKNLQKLVLQSSRIRSTGGYLKLPKLLSITWKVVPNFRNLAFLKPLENLKGLSLDMAGCPPEFKQEETVMQYLGEWHIPALFPALKYIKMRSESEGRGSKFKVIWEPV